MKIALVTAKNTRTILTIVDAGVRTTLRNNPPKVHINTITLVAVAARSMSTVKPPKSTVAVGAKNMSTTKTIVNAGVRNISMSTITTAVVVDVAMMIVATMTNAVVAVAVTALSTSQKCQKKGSQRSKRKN